MDTHAHARTCYRLAQLTVLAVTLAACAGAEKKPEPTVVSKPATVSPAASEAPAAASAPAKRLIKRPATLQPDYPARYTVAKGDTLWGIATRFLKDPWRWPELWQNNPQVANPHLIYPGDVLTLIYVDGMPTLQVARVTEAPPRERVVAPDLPPELAIQQLPEGFRPEGRVETKPYPTVKLSPQVHIEPLQRAVAPVRLDIIRQFLNKPVVLDRDEVNNLPYIFANADEHLIAGAGQKVYARGIVPQKAVHDYTIVRRGRTYTNPKDEDDILGYEAIYVGDAELVELGDPSTVLLTRTIREVLFKDHLRPGKIDEVDYNFIPHAPIDEVSGQIIHVVDGVTQIGQYNVVVIDRGRQTGIEPGHVLAIYQKGGELRDRVSGDDVVVPDIRAGVMVVFRVFDQVSYALVMDATRPIHLLDTVTNP